VTGLEITRRDARHAALGGLIDYAGLFPPAALDMDAAVAEFRAARDSSAAWMIDRFICPAGRLEELVGVLATTMTAGEEPWGIAVTTGPGWVPGLAADAGAVRTFDAAAGSAASVELVEIRIPDVPDVIAAADLDAVLTAFDALVVFEVPWQHDPRAVFEFLADVREERGRALAVKIRCGGLEAGAFPPPEAVARFIAAARERDLPFKATAGLHHPFRHTDPDTGFVHHGFVNLLVASGLAHTGADLGVLTAVLEDTDPSSFEIDRSGLRWKSLQVDHSTAGSMRSGLFLGYGSCSFAEPVDDLTRLGVLPA
jgi:hypothetical protein